MLDSNEGRVLKNWFLWTVVLKKTPESPLDSKEIKPVNLKGNQSWIVLGRTDAETEAPVFWWSDANSLLVGKVSDTGKDWGQKEKRASEDEMTGWHHQCNGHELGQTLGDDERQGGLECWSPWGYKETQLGNWTTTTQCMYHMTKCMISRYRNVVTSRFFFLKIPKASQWNIAEIYISFIDRWSPIFLRPCRKEKQDP